MAAFAETLKLDINKFVHDSKTKEVFLKVENDFEEGICSGVNGTHSFFINGNRLNSYDATYESLADAVGSLV